MRDEHPGVPLYVIFEGDWDAIYHAVKQKGLRGMMTSFEYKIAHVYGAQIIKTFTSQETIKVLKQLDKYTRNIRDMKVQFEPIHVSHNRDFRLRTLISIPKLGQTKGELLLEKYKSINNIINEASNSEKVFIKENNGIGKVIVENIKKIFEGVVPFYKPKTKVSPNKFIQRQNRYNKNKR